MNLYLASFPGVWHDGVAAVVADNEEQAKSLLLIEIKLQKIKRRSAHYPKAEDITLTLVDPGKSEVYIMDDGDE